jgi:hypothetical protein
MKDISQHGQCPRQDSNQASPKYMPRALSLHQPAELSLVNLVAFLYIVELCPHNATFCGTQDRYISTYKLSTCKQNTNQLLELFTSDRLLLLMRLIRPLQLLLLFLLSVQFLILYFGFQLPLGEGGLCPPLTSFSHLHLVLNKYFPRDFILFTFVQLIIFL